MAKFCSQCGRPLQEGEICTCQSQKKEAAQTPLQNQAAQNAQAQPQSQPVQSGPVPPQGQPGQSGPVPPQGQPVQNGQFQGGQIPPQGNPYGYGQGQQAQGGPVPPQYHAPYGNPQGAPYGYGQGQPMQGGQIPPQYGGNPYGNGQPGQQPYGAPQAPKQPGAAGIYMKGLWGTILDAYKKPAGTLANLASSGKTAVILGILGIQTILFSLIFLFLGFKLNSLAKSMSGGYLSVKVVNTPSLFFIALLGGAAVLAVWALVVMLFAKAMGKKKMTYMQGLGVSAAKALAQMPFTALTALVVLIFPLVSDYDPNVFTMLFAMLSYTVGSLLVYFFVPAGMDAFLADDKNKRIWQLFVTFLVNTIAVFIVTFIFCRMAGSSLSAMGRLF